MLAVAAVVLVAELAALVVLVVAVLVVRGSLEGLEPKILVLEAAAVLVMEELLAVQAALVL
jgi:hypothetical protein